MELPGRDDLKMLIERREGLCVSLFMPTERAGAETRQNAVRCKNLLREAQERLVAYGLRAADARELLEPARKLQRDSLFWRRQSDGIALFLSQQFFRCYRAPVSFDALVRVSDRFHVTPLLPLFTGDGRFYILALSQNQVRLLQCTRYTVVELAPDGIPKSLAEAMQYDDIEGQLQFRSQSPRGAGQRPSIHHGHGAGAEEEKERIQRYFEQIDRGMRSLLAEENAPMVLAGVDYLFPIYHEVNTYAHLAEQGVVGNPEGLSAEELQQQAWSIVQPRFLMAQQEAAAQYRQLRGTGRTANDIREALPAAAQGRVAFLFLSTGAHSWGVFDPDAGAVQVHDEPMPGDDELLDLAAIQTLLHGGSIYAVAPGEAPDGGSLAAAFRY